MTPDQVKAARTFIRAALEAAGVEFTDVVVPKVRLRKPADAE